MKRIFDKNKMSKLGKVKLVFCLFGPLISSYFNGLNEKKIITFIYIQIYIYIYIYRCSMCENIVLILTLKIGQIYSFTRSQKR